MRFHLIGLPHTSVTKEFSACAYTDRIRKWCNMMHDRGHEVFLYAGPKSDARCTEFIPCITEEDRARAVGSVHYTQSSFDTDKPHWQVFNVNARNNIANRIKPRDFICLTAGVAHKYIADQFPNNMAVEIMVGYGGVCTNFRVFESYAWMHVHYGHEGGTNPNGRFYDAVIPPNYELDDFPVKVSPNSYYLYLGRNVERKGTEIVERVCQDLKLPLVTAGPGGPLNYGAYQGVVGPEARGEMLSGATALFAPTIYVEPFGNVAVEAQLCGTPVICTDWGAFTETVEHNVTGIRCRTLAEFKAAADTVHKLDRQEIAYRARNKYNSHVIGDLFEDYFNRLNALWGNGWYS